MTMNSEETTELRDRIRAGIEDLLEAGVGLMDGITLLVAERPKEIEAQYTQQYLMEVMAGLGKMKIAMRKRKARRKIDEETQEEPLLAVHSTPPAIVGPISTLPLSDGDDDDEEEEVGE